MKKIIKRFWNWVLGLTTIDEAVVSTIKETKRRAKLVKNEAGDVVKAMKEVGNQLKDIPKAAKGKTRKRN
jgi:hypothetical protein|tara:strand:- start:1139 stop:1348 length:210 start_codon:yes stop_codon:yes gene_type:complete